jgi:hypothetical protein
MNNFSKISNSEGLLKVYTNESEVAKKLREKLKKMAENRGIEVKDKKIEDKVKLDGNNKR